MSPRNTTSLHPASFLPSSSAHRRAKLPPMRIPAHRRAAICFPPLGPPVARYRLASLPSHKGGGNLSRAPRPRRHPPRPVNRSGRPAPPLPPERPGPTALHPPPRRRYGRPACSPSRPEGRAPPRGRQRSPFPPTALPASLRQRERSRANRRPSRSPPRSARPWPRLYRRRRRGGGERSPRPLSLPHKPRGGRVEKRLKSRRAEAAPRPPPCSRGAGQLLPPPTRPAGAEGRRRLTRTAQARCPPRRRGAWWQLPVSGGRSGAREAGGREVPPRSRSLLGGIRRPSAAALKEGWGELGRVTAGSGAPGWESGRGVVVEEPPAAGRCGAGMEM